MRLWFFLRGFRVRHIDLILGATMDFKRVPLPADVADETRRVGLAVIGGTLFCTSQTCSHMEMEFRTRCVQAVSLDRLECLYPDYPDLRLLIVDEDLADDLLERADAYRALNRTAMIALGYRDVDIARHHYGRTREAGGAPIGYLSMNAPMEVLLSSMRMLFHGEYFLPQGLLGIAPPGTPAPDTAAPPAPATPRRRDLREALASHGAGEGDPRAGLERQQQQADRAAAGHHRTHREAAHAQHVREVRRLEPHRRGEHVFRGPVPKCSPLIPGVSSNACCCAPAR
jgi:hypothetical protein